mgnify:CR=1 FL=1
MICIIAQGKAAVGHEQEALDALEARHGFLMQRAVDEPGKFLQRLADAPTARARFEIADEVLNGLLRGFPAHFGAAHAVGQRGDHDVVMRATIANIGGRLILLATDGATRDAGLQPEQRLWQRGELRAGIVAGRVHP